MSTGLGADTLVRVWERGCREHPVDRALTILAAFTGRSRSSLASMSIQTRDEALLECRAALFDGPLDGYAQCPDCGCALSVSLAAGDPGAGPAGGEEGTLELDGREVSFRSPNSADLAAAAACETLEAARSLLIERCVGDELAEGAVDPAVVAAVEAEIERRAWAPAPNLPLTCPDCDHAWVLPLDVGAFLWDEVAAAAVRLLREVDELARRYGWNEAEILGLTAARRSAYLGLTP